MREITVKYKDERLREKVEATINGYEILKNGNVKLYTTNGSTRIILFKWLQKQSVKLMEKYSDELLKQNV